MYKPFSLVVVWLAAVMVASAQSYEQKIEDAMKRIDGVIARGPFKAFWESSGNSEGAGVVCRCEVRLPADVHLDLIAHGSRTRNL